MVLRGVSPLFPVPEARPVTWEAEVFRSRSAISQAESAPPRTAKDAPALPPPRSSQAFRASSESQAGLKLLEKSATLAEALPEKPCAPASPDRLASRTVTGGACPGAWAAVGAASGGRAWTRAVPVNAVAAPEGLNRMSLVRSA